MMEVLALKQQRKADYCDEAFMAGILSLIESLIDKPLIDIVRELNLGERLAAGLLRREGEMGVLLQLVESVEHLDLDYTDALLAQTGRLTLSDLTTAEIEAMAWSNQVTNSPTRTTPRHHLDRQTPGQANLSLY